MHLGHLRHLRHLLLASSISVAACGGSEQAPAEPTPVAAPAPKLVLGDARIALTAAEPRDPSGEIVLAPDGTLTATMRTPANEPRTIVARLSAAGELVDDKGVVVARLDGARVLARHVSVTRQGGKLMSSEETYKDVGALDDAGTFTVAKTGQTVAFDDQGNVVGMPLGVTIHVTAAPAQRKAAMFVVVAMFAGGKVTMDTASASEAPN